jgi:hypothetical protein
MRKKLRTPEHPVPREVWYGLTLTGGQAPELWAAARQARSELGPAARLQAKSAPPLAPAG